MSARNLERMFRCRALTGALALALTVLAAPVSAQVQPAMAVRAGGFTDQQFDQWVFQNTGNAVEARRQLNTLLDLQVEEIDRACKLTQAQKKKLLLTGRGDIKRFYDRYEEVKQKFQPLKNDQQRFQEIWQDISPLQITLQNGLFHNDSLLHRSLRNTLTDEQLAQYEVLDRQRREFRHRGNIELAVARLDELMPLRASQRRDLIALIMKETKPARRTGPYDFYFTMYQIGHIPKEKLK